MKMPKKIYEPEEDLELDEEEEEEDDEEFPEELPPAKKNVGKMPKTVKQIKAKATPRFVAFNVPNRSGIADAETDEVLAEGEYWLQQAIANIIERLERIENTQGAILEG